MTELFGAKVFLDQEDLVKLLVRLAVDLAFVTLIVRFVYFRLYRNHEYVFTYYLFNIITFTLCFLLRKVPIELGFALGLFAVFGILRYRTESIRIRDLTYLFIVIGLGILNALANKKISVVELFAVNAVITTATVLLELPTARKGSSTRPVLYDNIALLRPGAERELHGDLSQRLGVDVRRVEVQRVDMLRDAAELVVFFDAAATTRDARVRPPGSAWAPALEPVSAGERAADIPTTLTPPIAPASPDASPRDDTGA